MRLSVLDLVVIAAYFLSMVGIGLYFSRRQTSRDEYYLAGREMHWLLVGASVLATLLSTITYLSIPGEMIRYGIMFFAGTIAIPLAVPVVSKLIIPTITRMPITSAYQYLEKRYGNETRRLAGGVFLAHTLVWTGLIFYTASLAVGQVAGWDLLPTILIMGVVTIFYTSMGGIRTVIWTDNVQLLILFGGAISIPIYVAVVTGAGPSAWWENFSQAGGSQITFFSWDPTVRLTVVGVIVNIFMWEMCTHSSDQVAVQRYLSTPSVKAARNSMAAYAVFRVLLGLFLALCGLAVFAFYQQQSGLDPNAFQAQITQQADRLMPHFIAEQLSGGVAGLLLAALLAAAMSSLSSAINSAAGVLRSDFLPAGKTDRMIVDKLLVVGGGIIGMMIAVTVNYAMQRLNWNLVEMTGRLNHIFVGPLAALFFAGVLSKRVSQPAVLVGFVAGGLLSLYICFSTVSFMWVVPGSWTCAFLTSLLISRFTQPAPVTRVAGLTYGSLRAERR